MLRKCTYPFLQAFTSYLWPLAWVFRVYFPAGSLTRATLPNVFIMVFSSHLSLWIVRRMCLPQRMQSNNSHSCILHRPIFARHRLWHYISGLQFALHQFSTQQSARYSHKHLSDIMGCRYRFRNGCRRYDCSVHQFFCCLLHRGCTQHYIDVDIRLHCYTTLQEKQVTLIQKSPNALLYLL